MHAIDIENQSEANFNSEREFNTKRDDESSTALTTESGNLDDNDSPSSESTTTDKIYKIYKKIIHFEYSLHLIIGFILGLLYISALYNFKSEKIEEMFQMDTKTFYWTLITCITSHVIVHVVINIISSLFRTGTSQFNAFFFYVSDIKMYLSNVIILAWLIVRSKGGIINISNHHNLSIGYTDIYKILLEATIFFGFQRVLSRRISLSFNYGLHLERIRDCLIREYFISLLNTLSKISNSSGSNIDYEVPWVVPKKSKYYSFKRINAALFSDISRVEKDNACKRVLLDEFERRCNTSTGFHDDPFLKSKKFRKYASTKARKLSNKLINNKITKFSDILKYFADKDILHSYLSKLKLNHDQTISPDALENIIIKYGEEKYYLHMSLRQMNLALNRVNYFVSTIAIIIFTGILFSYIVNMDNPFLAFFGTIFGTSFVLNSSIENAVSCTIFLFFIHPYDVGDRIFVNLDNKEENLVVTELNVFSTVFIRWDGVVLVVPNQILREKSIINIRRSNTMTESHRIQIDVKTPPEKIEKMKIKLQSYLISNNEMFTDFLMVNFESIENNNILHVRVVMQYKKNWQNYDKYLELRSEFLTILNSVLKSCQIDYKPLVQKINIKSSS
ncbi:Mechanosensitive ion channel protein 7 [Dictyocoela muelleri]|nr:Mechanosensitive ion channel protein 7 [Dictyocoela muelleri]